MPMLVAEASPSLHSTQIDRRKFERESCELVALVESVGHPTVRASVEDVSDGGVGLTMNRPFPKGTILTLNLSDGDKDHGQVQVRVVRASFRREVGWFVGAAFLA